MSKKLQRLNGQLQRLNVNESMRFEYADDGSTLQLNQHGALYTITGKASKLAKRLKAISQDQLAHSMVMDVINNR